MLAQVDPRVSLILRLTIIVLLLLLGLLLVGVIGISVFVGRSLTSPARAPIVHTPTDVGLEFESIAFLSPFDQLRLQGWWIDAAGEAQATVVFAHGYGSNRAHNSSLMHFAAALTAAGFNVLTFDFRASGESEGTVSSIGKFEQHDLLGAVEFVKQEKGGGPIHLIGWSMGGVTAILAGMQSEDVVSIVADSPFSDLRQYLQANLPYWSGLPAFPFTRIILALLPRMVGVDLDLVSPVNAVGGHSTPLLLIHSRDDQAIPYTESEYIYRAANSATSSLWLTDRARHVETSVLYPEEYERRIMDFFFAAQQP